MNWYQNSGQSQTFGREWLWIVSIYPDLGLLVDMFLPSYQRCPVSFLKKILSSEKIQTINFIWLMWRLITLIRCLRNRQVIFFEIPKYPEMRVKNVWSLIQENEDLLSYFPDLKPSQLPEKDFMYGIMNTLEPEGVRVGCQ